jgi:serine/threonine-protein kinase
MSSVFRAVHVETGHEVALKVLTRTLARNPTLLHRFLREAKSAETLVHPNIVTIYDRGIDEGRHYLVLEYVSGGDLHEYVQRRGPMSVAEAVAAVKSVASALAYAAGKGLIHRDVKPSNILRTKSGAVKIIDLGLALRAEGEDERITRDGTTVGTVDYMAPEQARDSRATSIQSDIYSLGCTFYYLLTGVPVYPGGDITDKLTRHARAPVPDVHELRPDVAPALAALIQRMMAKQPEDRFASYDALIEALSEAGKGADSVSPGAALAPIAEDAEVDLSGIFDAPGKSALPGREEDGGDDAAPYTLEASAGAALEPLELAGPDVTTFRPHTRAPAPLPRLGSASGAAADQTAQAVAPGTEGEPAQTRSPAIWVVGGLAIGIACVVLGLGLMTIRSRPAVPESRPAAAPNTDAVAAPIDRAIEPLESPDAGRAGGLASTTHSAGAGSITTKRVGAANAAPERWEEPTDDDGGPPEVRGASEGWRYLPEWARQKVPERIEGPFVVVRRLPEPGEVATVPALHTALDSNIGGTVELADEGPLYLEDVRLPGGSRLIRARAGLRPIVRIDATTHEPAREQHAVFVLEGKDLILDGIDFVIWVPDLSSSQTALFSCAGGSLTIRNCSFTILNPRSPSFAFVRVDSPAGQPARVRLERTLVRGGFTAGFDAGGESLDLVLERSVVLEGLGPFLRFADRDSVPKRRLYVLESVVACVGPFVEGGSESGAARSKPVLIRAYGSAIVRLRSHGESIASVISFSNARADAARLIDWAGDRNLYAGWKGFAAFGRDHAITVLDLAAVRAEWGASERDSRMIESPWSLSGEPSRVVAGDLSSLFAGRQHVLAQVAQPRAGLFEKTIGRYADPAVPELVRQASDEPSPGFAGARGARINKPIAAERSGPSIRGGQDDRRAAQAALASAGALAFDTQAEPWNGDLGAFLRERAPGAGGELRVRVVGHGSHSFTPVQLPRGMRLEIRVETSPGAEPISWRAPPEVTGRGLLELEGGSLALVRVVLRHDESSGLEHLIYVEDGHLALSRCQLIAPAAAREIRGDLIAFRATSTRPVSDDAADPLFARPVDRPVCRMNETVLITGGKALRVELGRGLVALWQCALASGETAIELVPSRVARARFEADLWLDHCTIASERTIVRMGRWPGLPPGPDRPWLITSRNCAFVAMYDRKVRSTALLRSDAESIEHGAVFWQGHDDAADVDLFATTGDAPALPNRARDVQFQWVRFWGHSHMTRISGPRGPGSPPTVRLLERLRPGHVEPGDLILDKDHHPDREQLTVGADLARLGITPRVGRAGRQRN